MQSTGTEPPGAPSAEGRDDALARLHPLLAPLSGGAASGKGRWRSAILVVLGMMGGVGPGALAGLGLRPPPVLAPILSPPPATQVQVTLARPPVAVPEPKAAGAASASPPPVTAGRVQLTVDALAQGGCLLLVDDGKSPRQTLFLPPLVEAPAASPAKRGRRRSRERR